MGATASAGRAVADAEVVQRPRQVGCVGGVVATTGGSTILGLSVTDRDAVDVAYVRLTGAGYHVRQPPYNAFRGARYAIVDDPDG